MFFQKIVRPAKFRVCWRLQSRVCYGRIRCTDVNLSDMFQVCQVNKVFQSSLQLLNIYHLKQEPQYRTNLSDLWMILDFNGFVTNAFFSD